MSTSSYMDASSLGGRSLRRTHLTAIFLPVARCVPRQTVAKEPDFSYIFGVVGVLCFTGDETLRKR